MAEKKRQSVRSNRCCFTLNFQGEATWPAAALEEVQRSLEEFHQAGKLRFAIVGKEVAPTTGTPHLQGFIHVLPTALPASQGTVGTWKKLFPFLARAHLETARGDDSKNLEYCSKSSDILVNLGDPQKKRTLAEFSMLPLTEQLAEDGEMAVKSRFQLDSIGKRLKMAELEELVAKEHEEVYQNPPLLAWQEDVIGKLVNQDRRSVFFVIDPIGGIGKTHLAQYLNLHPDFRACTLGVGKRDNLAMAFTAHFLEHHNRYTIFDLTRCFEEQTWPFAMIEELKNGSYMDPKYESKARKCFLQKIIVFCNKEPDNMKLSFDRVRKFIVEDNKLVELYIALFSIPRMYLDVRTLATAGIAAAPAAAADSMNVGAARGASVTGASVVVDLAPGGVTPGYGLDSAWVLTPLN